MDTSIRAAAVAGLFYPGTTSELGALVDRLLAEAPARRTHPALDRPTFNSAPPADDADESARPPAEPPVPKAIVVPHAGYVYSGPIAAAAFKLFQPIAESLRRIVLIGPAHRAHVDGLASPGAAALATPLGQVRVDGDALARLPGVHADPRAHAREHSLEVELPFLQRVAPHAAVVPLVVGDASPELVGRVLETLWGGPETRIVISSDLSHYLPYEAGRRADSRTARRITSLDALPLGPDEACGCAAINGLLWTARRKHLRGELIDLRSSGDTAGPRDEVVGYGAFAFHENTPDV
jgi:AmmeMemoRadiSam system protein B